ncbi:MAG: hypothetical protein WC438_03770 [Candidatus Pacearchaeota archaeon]
MTKKTSANKIMDKEDIEKALLNNFINLQKVLTNLAVRFDELSTNISKMLQLFEISAKSFSEKYEDKSEGSINKSDNELLKKLDSLLDQNKTIARGIILMEDKIKQREPRHPLSPENFEASRPKPLPKF